MYGQTECKRVSYLPPEELKTKPNSVGIAMSRVKTYIIDEERTCLCPPYTEGELIVSGPNVMLGYWNDPQATAEKIKTFHGLTGKFLFTNDIFTMDEDGYLYFVRRKDDTLKIRGIKVSPREIEIVLESFPGIKESFVFGIEDYYLGKAIKAIIIPEKGIVLDKNEILEFCFTNLEPTLVPKFLHISETLPLLENGKLDKETIKAYYK